MSLVKVIFSIQPNIVELSNFISNSNGLGWISELYLYISCLIKKTKSEFFIEFVSVSFTRHVEIWTCV